MYKINVKSKGKDSNNVLGNRYNFSKRNAKKTIALFLADECEIEVTKLLNCGGCWAWSKDHSLYGGYREA